MTQPSLTFAVRRFGPSRLAFSETLGPGYFIVGLFSVIPKPEPRSRPLIQTMGMWGFWMARFLPIPHQALSHCGIERDLTSLDNPAPLYMAGLAFTVYGIHWFSDGVSPLHRVERRAGRMDGYRLSPRFGTWGR